MNFFSSCYRYRHTLPSIYNKLSSALKSSHIVSKARFARRISAVSNSIRHGTANCSEINIELDGHPICRVEHAKSLGLIIDDRLSWSNHIKELCKKISSAIGALRRIRSLISQSTAVQIYNALIQPHFDYCAPFWDGLSSYLCEKLQKLQNRIWYKRKPASWNFEVGPAIIKKKKAESYIDV